MSGTDCRPSDRSEQGRPTVANRRRLMCRRGARVAAAGALGLAVAAGALPGQAPGSAPGGGLAAGTPFALPAAQAHSQLISSVPADGASVQNAPKTTALTFNEQINPNFAQVVVVSVDGEPRSVDVSTSGATVTASMPGGLAAGRITVRYRVVSKDGHPIEGEISFTAETGPAGEASTTDLSKGGAGDTQAVSPESASRSSAQEESAGFSPWGYPLVGTVALILIGIGVALRKRPRRHT